MATYFSHSSAVIDEGAQIGTGTKVWHFCHVMPGAQIGENCILGQNVFVAGGVEIGQGVKIQNNVSVYKGVVLEDEVFVGPSVVFTNVINPRAGIERKDEFLPTRVSKGATIGANATVLCGVHIGEYAFIGAGAVITGDVSPYAQVTGNPGRITGWRSEAGSALKFVDGMATCQMTGDQYTKSGDVVMKKK